ncbi:MAG: hypothetical protein IPN66_06825 [Candidatus Competibacteraceae bacterium]|nr:hypothetical protein [Candidatus Competibacteraceae bacterium]
MLSQRHVDSRQSARSCRARFGVVGAVRVWAEDIGAQVVLADAGRIFDGDGHLGPCAAVATGYLP